jgi:hypothetical protein
MGTSAGGKTGRSGLPPATPNLAIFPDHGSTDPVLFTRDDWMLFRDVSQLPIQAGVRKEWLPRVAVKELMDNALDARADGAEYGMLPADRDEFRFYVADGGPGLAGTNEQLAAHFSIGRPLTSSKTRRMPTRGMLGNGLRVVTAVVLVGGGALAVCTRGRRLTLRPRMDGTTAVERVEPWEGSGTRVEVTLAGEMAELAAEDDDLFGWAEEAKELASRGCGYKGKSSPWWYGPHPFWELLQAAKAEKVVTVEKVVETLDGCSAKEKIREVVGDLWGRPAHTLTPAEAEQVLARARAATKAVTAERLGRVGERGDYSGYDRETGTFERDGVVVPFVVEVWANRADEPAVTVCVNRTPIVTDVACYRKDGMQYVLSGAGLLHRIPIGQKVGGEYRLVVNVTAPVVPLTGKGKDPDLRPVLAQLAVACRRAVQRCRRASPNKAASRATQKGVILAALPGAAARLREGGNIFSLRQLYYAVRPLLKAAIGREPDYKTFSKIVTRHEEREGDVEGMYRDDRGILYHPHTGETLQLGTRSVAVYQRPAWGFNKILFIEKEGFIPVLRNAGWPERHDCALVTSKGFASRAARDVMRLIGQSGEPATAFVVHDADWSGTCIYDKVDQSLTPRGLEVINLGLDPDEAIAMGLEVEPVDSKRRKKNGAAVRTPTGRYLRPAEREWLQRNRVELNAMSTAQFIAWLDRKMAAHSTGKVIPPAKVVRDQLTDTARARLTQLLCEKVIREARVEERVADLMAGKKRELAAAGKATAASLGDDLTGAPHSHWSKLVGAKAAEIAAAWAGSA